jgi:hypothetical protein
LWDCDWTARSRYSRRCRYPQNLPNAAPESWITIQATWMRSVVTTVSLDGCRKGRLVGAVSTAAGQGCGRIDEHGSVEFGTRAGKVLAPVQALHVMDDSWPVGASADDNVVFLDDDAGRYCCCYRTAMVPPNRTNPPMNSFWAVPVFLPIKFLNLRCGTFDGLHFWSSQIVNLGHVLGESSHWSIVGVKRRNAEKKETLNTFLV